MPRDDVERARNVRNALANASVSERKRRGGNGFPPPPLPPFPPPPPYPPPPPPRATASTLLSSTLKNRPVCASPIHSRDSPPFLFSPPPLFRAQHLSLWYVSSHFLAIPSGNYYKSESQSIFNPRGMVFSSGCWEGGKGRRVGGLAGGRARGGCCSRTFSRAR